MSKIGKLIINAIKKSNILKFKCCFYRKGMFLFGCEAVSPVIDAKTLLFHMPKTAKLAISMDDRQNILAIVNLTPKTSRSSGSKLSLSSFLFAFRLVNAFLTKSVNGYAASVAHNASG